MASDAAWAAANGDEALQLALDSTEWVLRLPFPPPDADALAPAGQIGPLTRQAASGVPELWPVFRRTEMGEAQTARLRYQFAARPPLPR